MAPVVKPSRPRSSYRAHGLGEANELIDRLINYEELSPLAKVRARKSQK